MVSDLEPTRRPGANQPVLILVLMEYGLGLFHFSFLFIHSSVLILVLMEYGLGPKNNYHVFNYVGGS